MNRCARRAGPGMIAWSMIGAVCLTAGAAGPRDEIAGPLPRGVRAVWDLNKAYRETTATRQRICINGLWRWRPASPDSHQPPRDGWGYFKAPGCWPGITNYMQKDCQRVIAHPSWKNIDLSRIQAAWYEREITIPAEWSRRRITIETAYLNSYAAVYLDGRLVGEMRFPAGSVELASACHPGARHTLSLLVVALPLQGVMLSYTDSNAARQVKGAVARRGLCGDIYLASEPVGERLGEIAVNTSVRRGTITVRAAIANLAPHSQRSLRIRVLRRGRAIQEWTSGAFGPGNLTHGWIAVTEPWRPRELWDIHTPENMYRLSVSLLDARGGVLDTAYPLRFGFREFWIDGRDFYLNGTRIHLRAVPLDNAQVGAAWASYEGARESLTRLQGFGVNFVYTHNYGCQPGSHLSFSEILRAADDVGMLVALSQPHFSHYDWRAEDAGEANGYARHARFYASVAGSHPSVVMYSMSHNATGYSQDMNPDMIDGLQSARTESSLRNVQRALRAEAIVRRIDPSRIVYHHSSGNLSSMHTSNFYPNWAPIQELSDWFEHWASQGVKPFFACEYGAPFMWDWAMYRGWYRGVRNFGGAMVPWDFCLAEWNSQFLGDKAFQISEEEKENLRWEARRFRAGDLWHRWDYPHALGSSDFDERYPVLAAYLQDNWRAYRTWGVSAISPWQHGVFWKLRPGVAQNEHVELKTDWDRLQRPGFSPDYIEERYERRDLAYNQEDWLATPAADAMMRNNRPLLAYIAGGPERFTSKDHNFLPGETVEKQAILINDSRTPRMCDVAWSLALPQPIRGAGRLRVDAGGQQRIPISAALPNDLPAGAYELSLTARFQSKAAGVREDAEIQRDRFTIHVLPPPVPARVGASVALFDPRGETNRLLEAEGIRLQRVDAAADLSGYDLLIIGKGALTADGPAPDLAAVRDGLRVVMFEQTSEALEKRLGFRVEEYGLRSVFRRIPDHPIVAGLEEANLRDWRGAATLTPPRLDYQLSNRYNGAPSVWWCGIEVPRLWRCGNYGDVASVLIEKPARGDFLPILDGGFSLQYSPLLEYREGRGVILFCQMDVTERTRGDPAARRLAANLLNYAASWKPAPRRRALYVGDRKGREYLEAAGVKAPSYEGGELGDDQVLIVGRGGGRALAAHAPQVARWLESGGRLLALELDAGEANRFLPTRVRTAMREHIACFFEPPGADSLLAGVGSADVHNRDPRQLPLIAGAAAVGDGVLARIPHLNVVFCQLVPYSVSNALGAPPSLAVDREDAVEGRQSALVTMGTAPWGQFGQKVSAGRVGEKYTLAVFVKSVGRPVRVRLEVERAGRPWDRALRAEDREIGPGEWTELHATFTVERPFPEGWQAYLHCAGEGGRLRADWFRLYKGEYVRGQGAEGRAAATRDENLFVNPGFESGAAPWFFKPRAEQQNLRRTYRRSAFLLARLLANMGVAAETPLLSRFATPVHERTPASIIQNGDFRIDADHDGAPDGWRVSPKQAAGVLEKAAGVDPPSLRIARPESDEREKSSVMLAQYDVPVKEGQWYRISLEAKAEGLSGRVTLAVSNTVKWRSLLEYQRFSPSTSWRKFTFLAPAKGTAAKGTRFQIWHDRPGVLWLRRIRMTPCDPPSQGRWLDGLYADQPQAWDDPYRFFRW